MTSAAEMTDVRRHLAQVSLDFEADLLYPHDAEKVMGEARAIINMASAIEASAAARVAQGASWQPTGAKSAAEWFAKRRGSGVADAADAIDTANRRKKQAHLDAAARRGDVSDREAAEISKASAADPSAEDALLGEAAKPDSSLSDLKKKCSAVKAAAEPDPDAAHRERRARRHLRQRQCDDGSTEVTHASTTDETAEIWAACEAIARRMFRDDRLRGVRRTQGQRMADALLELVRVASGGATSGDDDAPAPRLDAKVTVRVDWDALVRGNVVEGETCDIAGVGPVPVSIVRDLLASGDPFVAAILTKGTDVLNVAHLGRQPTAKQRTALDWMQPGCTVEGCDTSVGLQIDHRHDWAETKMTLLAWLDRLCTPHHDKKTHHGWKLVDGAGKRAFVPPDDARHPDHPIPDQQVAS